MTQAVIDQGVARWSAGQRHVVQITTPDGSLLDWYPLPLPVQHPGPEILRHTDWTAYPGTEWQEEPPGQWTCAVYRHGTPTPPQQGVDRVPR